jgi:hypothetical protein
MAFDLNNRWRHGPTNFDLPPFDELFGSADGVVPLPVTLDPDVGPETVLFLRDETPFIDQLAALEPFRLEFKTGVAETDFGPVGFLLFWVADPRDPSQPFAAYDVHLDPHSEQHLTLYGMLASQSHWHVILVGAGNEQRNLFEFENTFGLSEALEQMEHACRSLAVTDLDLAKTAFMRDYSIMELFDL